MHLGGNRRWVPLKIELKGSLLDSRSFPGKYKHTISLERVLRRLHSNRKVLLKFSSTAFAFGYMGYTGLVAMQSHKNI